MADQRSSAPAVTLDASGVRIDGEPVILLSASLFYFRIPHELWSERLAQVKALGYNAIDVYFPWNHHEEREGAWRFDGMRDAELFLQLAAEAGLWVVARPGPYICSEWDGGGLPAYLFAKEGLTLRDNAPAYLRAAAEWFGRILPILARYQAGEGGTVICVQLENELDFYACADPSGYIGALRDMAASSGIRVPLVACAGQGGLREASGLTEGVVPACNFYPNDRDPEFETKVAAYRDALADMNYPLLVTETNRSHFLLRRLLSAGAKLLGPYLQASGTDFGFTNAINNWGKPLAFLTSDYDFGGMIGPEGQLRPEAHEGRLLGSVVRTYGRALALAVPLAESAWRLLPAPDQSPDAAGMLGPFELRLAGGGSLLFVSHAGDQEAAFTIGNGQADLEASLAPFRSMTLPADVPLAHWSFAGRLASASAELYRAEEADDGLALAFHSEGGAADLRFELNAELADIIGGTAERLADGWLIRAHAGGDTHCALLAEDGRRLTIRVTDTRGALESDANGPGGEERIVTPRPLRSAADEASAADGAAVKWKLGAAIADAPPVGAASAAAGIGHAVPLERLGVYRGYAWYESAVRLPEAAALAGVLLRNASDVVSLYVDGKYVSTAVPGGGAAYLPLPSAAAARGETRLSARTEIWGHSNFDDPRQPALRLNALKGLTGMTAVLSARDITAHWRLCRDAGGRDEWPSDERLLPFVNFGGWLTSDLPTCEMYQRTVATAAHANAWYIHFDGLDADARLLVNGQDAGAVRPQDPFVDVTAFIRPGERAALTVRLYRSLGRSCGRVMLYEGIEAGYESGYTIRAVDEDALRSAADSSAQAAANTELPLALEPGAMAWLHGSIANARTGAGWRVRAAGSGLKLTALFGGRIVGRLWLPGGEARPTMTGGSPDSFYLPGPWFRNGDNRLSLMLEAVDARQQGRLASLAFIPV